VANYNEIKAILQKSVGGALNAQELDNLAKAIVSSTGAAGAVDTASIQKQRDLAAVLGRVAEMRKLDVSLAEKQFEIAKLNVKAAIDQGETIQGPLTTALQDAEKRFNTLSAAQERAGAAGQVFAGVMKNTAQSMLNLGNTGLTTQGTLTDLYDGFKSLTGAANEYKSAAQKAAEEAKTQDEEAKKRLKALQEKQDKTKDLVAGVGALAEAESDAEAATKALADANAGLAKETDKAGGSTGKLLLGVNKLVNSKFGKGIAKQFDPLNIAFSRVQQIFEQVKTIQQQGLEVYKATGLTSEDGGRFRDILTEQALASESLSVQSDELVSSLVNLQAAYSKFDPDPKKMDVAGIATTFAILEQAGISSQQSAENFAFFRDALGKTDAEAEQLTLNMMALADELKRPPSEIAAAFQQGSKSLAAYGNNFVKVQEKMIRVASKLGIEVSGLIGSFDAMDTIEGAAETAGAINQILGAGIGEGLNAIALANADIPDKIKMVRETILDMDPSGALMDNRKIVKAVSEKLGMDPGDLHKLLKNGVDTNKELLMETRKQKKEDIAEKTFKNLTSDQKAKLESEKLTGMQEEASGVMDFVARNQNTILGVGSAISAGVQIAGMVSMFKGGKGGGAAAALRAVAGGGGGGGGGEGGGGGGGLLGDCVRICNDSLMAMGDQFGGGGVGDVVPPVGGVGGLGGAAGAAGAAGTAGTAGAAGAGGVGLGAGLLGGAVALAGGLALGNLLYDSLGSQESGNQTKALMKGGGYLGGTGGTAIDLSKGKSEFAEESRLSSGIDWAKASTKERYNYCANNNGNAPPNQGGPSCGAVNYKFNKEAGNLTGKVSPRAKTPTVNDFTVSDFKSAANANMSDEIVGIKEGGLIARKLDKLISLMAGGNGKEIVLKIDRKEIARSVISTVNNDFYNVGV